MYRLAFCFLLVFLFGCRYVNDAQDTLFNETKASRLLEKYEWFKDAAAQCEAKLSTIEVLKHKQKNLINTYEGEARKKWAREDREAFNLWEQELVGLKGSYNQLAAEYNSQMSKFNYRFCNVGDLPAGASIPLPREFKPYLED